jgi:hypothetical protein
MKQAVQEQAVLPPLCILFVRMGKGRLVKAVMKQAVQEQAVQEQ